MSDRARKVVMIYLEPTPYILGLIEVLIARQQYQVVARFVSQDLSQNWQVKLPEWAKILPGGSFKSFVFLWRELTPHKGSILHLAGWGHPLLVMIFIMAWIRRIPLVVESDTQLQAGSPILKRVLKHLILGILFRIPRIFLPGGTRQAKYLNYYGVDSDRIQIAQMTVDVKKIIAIADSIDNKKCLELRKVYGLPEEGVIFLFVGRLEHGKGLIELMEVFRSVSADCKNCSLAIVGDGSLIEKVNRMASEINNIYVLGRLSGEDVYEVMSICDVFVLPSHAEAWGLVINEAMAAGLPVIANDCVGATEDLVDDGKTGLLVKGGESADLRHAVVTMENSADMRQHMSKAAREKISGWTLENEAVNVTAAWEKACAR